MPRRKTIVVAINAVFVVNPNAKVEFLKALQDQIIEATSINHDDSTKPTVLQFVLGEDLDEEGTFHCHWKYECVSNPNEVIPNVPPLVWETNPTAEWRRLQETSSLLAPPIYHAWTPKTTTARRNAPFNPKHISPGTTTFCLNASLYIHPDHREELLSLLEYAQCQSIQEPLCVEYQYGESLTIPNTFHVHQRYLGRDGGKEGFDLHATTSHYQKWKQFASNKARFTQETVGYTFRNHRPDIN